MNKKYFPKHLEGRFVGKKRWELTELFIYLSKIGGRIEVPIGFVSDGASIPRLAQLIIGSPWSGKFVWAAIIHDWGYYSQTMTRKKVDLIFLEAMTVLGVPWWKRQLMHKAVRLGGWIPWHKHKKTIV